MTCSVHADREAAGRCTMCGRGFCRECLVHVAGQYQCRTCAASALIPPAASKSPALAGVLSFLIVGVGQLYNGQGLKGVLMFLGGLITLGLCFVVVGFFLFPIIWLWSVIDAVLAAQAINRGELPRPMPPAVPQAVPAARLHRAPGAPAGTPAQPTLDGPVPAPPALGLPDISALFGALRDQKQAQRLIANLEKMKAEGSVTEAEYDAMRGGYVQTLNEASVRAEAAKEALQEELASAQSRLEELRKTLRESELRCKVGELSEPVHLAERERLEPAITQAEAFAERLEQIVAATDPEELRPYAQEDRPEPAAATPVLGAESVPSLPRAATDLARLGARIPLRPEIAPKLAWLSVGAMFVAAVQSFPYSAAGIALVVLAVLTSLAAAACVIAFDSPSFRLGRVAAAGFGVVLWLGGLAVLWGRISWWFFGLASVALLASALVQLRD